MKKVKTTTVIMLMAFVGLTTMSCNESQEASSTTYAETQESQGKPVHQNELSEDYQQVIEDYVKLKDALVATDEKASAEAGKQLENSLKAMRVDAYDSKQQNELNEIIEMATEHAEHISRSDIAHQREHFKLLSLDIIDMIAITGTFNTLYQQHCPMYESDGGTWLSLEKEIRNPYFGSKMMNCGDVQREIN